MTGRRVDAFGRKRRNRLVGLSAGGVPWGPATDPDLSAWYDVEDTSTLTVNGGGFITEIRNKVAGVLPNYNQGNPGEIPDLVTVDGHDMANFDGTDWWANTPGTPVGVRPGAADFTVAMLVRTPATNPLDGITWIQRDSPGLFPTWWLTLQRNEAEFIVRDTAGTALVQAMDETWADGSTRWIIIGQRDGANARLFFATGPTVNESSASPVAIVDVTDINAANSNVGSVASGLTNFWGGDLGEWLMIKRAMSASELATLAGYLTRKWELTGP